MTIKIQKILYDLIKDNISTHSVYSCKSDNIKLPYILIQNIEIEKLPYSEELYRYDNVDATLVIQNQEYSNKESLNVMEKISNLLRGLTKKYQNIKNLSLKTSSECSEKFFTAEIKINFTYLN